MSNHSLLLFCWEGNQTSSFPLPFKGLKDSKVTKLSLKSHFKVILGRYTELNLENVEVLP